MKKLVFISSILLSTSVLADQIQQPVETFNHWDMQLKVLSLNDKLIQNAKDIKLGYQIQAKYNFDKNFYAKANLALYRHGHIGYGVVGGVQQAVGLFRPYAEFGYSSSYNQDDVKSHSFTYDAGTNIVIDPKLTTWVEFDNFVQKGKEGMTFGASYSVKKNIVVGGDFQYLPSTKDNNADVFVDYLF